MTYHSKHLIHPTAIIEDGAVLGEATLIGPYAVIESGAVLGSHCIVQGHAIVCASARLGAHNFIGWGAILGADPQAIGFDPFTDSTLVVGDHNTIREYATLHRGSLPGSATILGNQNFLMAGAHVGHDCQIGHQVVIANNCLLGGHVSVGNNAFLGGGSVYHQFIRIGQGAITQGKSGFGKDLPPYMIGAGVNRVAGVNVVGLRRLGFPSTDRAEIKSLFKLFFRSGLPVATALEEARTKEWGTPARAVLDFIASTGKRGLCSGFRKGEREHDLD